MLNLNCFNPKNRNSVPAKGFGPVQILLNFYRRTLIGLTFAFFAATVAGERPMKRWLVVPSFVGVWLAGYFKWGITGFAIYVFIVHGIHMPWWLTAGSLLTSVILKVALAATKMEMNQIGYLNS